MLYIVRKDGREVTWHVGQLRPLTYKYNKPLVDVVCIQADGHELDYIKKHFTGIPMSDRLVVEWKDGMAQFIYDNL